MLKDGVITDLYYGKISPHERSGESCEQYKLKSEKLIQSLNELRKLLDESSQDVLEEFLKCNGELNGYTEEENFKQGFVLGAKLMIELYADK